MELINFLDHTDHRHLKLIIAYKVKDRLRELTEDLEHKRCRLRRLFAFENLKYDEELALLIQKRIEENARKRQEWFGVKRVEKQLQEEKFLKLKKLQRELENCEEIRHLQSKQILMETKQAQLYQIEERRALREKEQQIEQMWLQTMQGLNEEKGKQEIYEKQLCVATARSNQAKNAEQLQQREAEKRAHTAALRKEFAEDDARAAQVDRLCREMEINVKSRRRLHQRAALEKQIDSNRLRRELRRQCGLAAEFELNKQSHKAGSDEKSSKLRQKEEFVAWQHLYMEHVLKETKSKLERDQQVDNMYLGSGSVLQQQTKNPYHKAVR